MWPRAIITILVACVVVLGLMSLSLWRVDGQCHVRVEAFGLSYEVSERWCQRPQFE